MAECTIEPCQELEAAGAAPRAGSLYYGWIMLPLTMAALVASAPGQTFGVSIFNEPMRLSLGLSYGQLSAAYMVGTLLGALPITYVGVLMDRHGPRKSMLTIVSLFSIACLVTSQVHGWPMLVVAFCLLRMLGPGALAFTSSNTLAFWFERRLGMVEGIRQLGMGGAMLLIPTLNLWLITQWGWRGAYALLGGVIWCTLFPLFSLYFRDRPEDVGHLLDGAHSSPTSTPDVGARVDLWWGFTLEETLRTFAFWIVTAGTAVFSLVHTAVFFCLVPIFHERGLTSQDAAVAMTAFAACLALMQLTGGTLADHVRAPVLLFTGTAGLACGVFMVYVARTPLAAALAAAALGAAQGVFFGTAQPLWARYFGRRHIGKIRGVLMTINVAASSVGPLFAGITHDMTGSFGTSLVVFSMLPLPIALLSLFAWAPRRPAAETADG